MNVDLAVLRVRFTPARGEVYGPPTAIAGPASPLPPGVSLPPVTLGGRLHEIVPERESDPQSEYAVVRSTSWTSMAGRSAAVRQL